MMAETIYNVLQELWVKCTDAMARSDMEGGTREQYSQSKREALDDAAVKINAIVRRQAKELPEIPPGKSLSLGKMPYFFSVPYPKGPSFKRWFVEGLAEDLPEGEAVEVHRYGDDEKQVVVIREHEYERVVHRGKDKERRYVLASFDREGW
jgi:hypothetical protein